MGGNYTQVPTLLLKGKWLEEVGFKAGEYVEVNVKMKLSRLPKQLHQKPLIRKL